MTEEDGAKMLAETIQRLPAFFCAPDDSEAR